MLILTVESTELFDEVTETFVNSPGATIELEHSLVSLSKWESKWEKPFLSDAPKTTEETIDYIKCMTLSSGIPDEVYTSLSQANLKKVSDYIRAKMSATWFAERKQPPGKREVITAEVIYYWMVGLQIPFECQYWHLERLLTLVRVCNAKNTPDNKPKRATRNDLAARRALNEARRAQTGSAG